MFIVTVSVREVTPEGDEVIRVGKLYLVDLAGSENITRWVGRGVTGLGGVSGLCFPRSKLFYKTPFGWHVCDACP